ncbi:hypothetical protein BDR06DRAFT_1012084 [Suillus hirtellus]|nr:hypothetical protein BDR06DRAFT_1012084 [Suillus hirtellus]
MTVQRRPQGFSLCSHYVQLSTSVITAWRGCWHCLINLGYRYRRERHFSVLIGGHLLSLDLGGYPRNPFLTVAGWINEHGPLITIRSGTKKIVIIGRHDAFVDIMEKQGGLLADRPRLIAVGESLNGGVSVILTPSGNTWRRMRRFSTSYASLAYAICLADLQAYKRTNRKIVGTS